MFVQWGSKQNECTISNIKLTETLCPVCKKPTRANFIFRAKVSEVYWISLGKGSINNVFMLCLECGKTFELEFHARLYALRLFKESTKGKESDYPNPNDLIEETETDVRINKHIFEKKGKVVKGKILCIRCGHQNPEGVLSMSGHCEKCEASLPSSKIRKK